MAAVMGIAFASCEKGGDEPGALTLSRTSATLIEGQTRDVQASYGGEDVTASATWTSSDEAVATVSAGTITAVGAGNATITCEYSGATATVQVTVGAGTAGVADLLQGSEYILIQLGETAYGQIEDKVICDLRANGGYNDDGTVPEGVSRVYDIWNAFEAAEAPQSGMDCFGNADGWFSIASVSPKPDNGWGNISGGLAIKEGDTEIQKMKLTSKHVFAIALKGNYTKENKLDIKLFGSNGNPEVNIITVQESTGANNDGDWQVYTVTMEELIKAGIDLTEGVTMDPEKKSWYAFGYAAVGSGVRADIAAVMYYVPAE